jgi:metal-responsive CopG/Arc/MetJ family transcriptional regulator
MRLHAIKTSISLPQALLSDLRMIAKKESQSLSAVMLQAARHFVQIRKWQLIQMELAVQARKMGLSTEADVDRMIHQSRK